jgi:hypothetical protein
MRGAHLVVAVPVRASAHDVWAALTDWDAQGEWMAATRVRAVDGDRGHRVGAQIEAFTGCGRFGFLDTMVVEEWRPPVRCVVRHTGTVVRGTGVFEISPDPRATDRVHLTWHEYLELPGGAPGVCGFAVARPALVYFVRHSLTRLARLVEDRVGAQLGSRASP